MATVKLSNAGNVLLKGDKVSCTCCDCLCILDGLSMSAAYTLILGAGSGFTEATVTLYRTGACRWETEDGITAVLGIPCNESYWFLAYLYDGQSFNWQKDAEPPDYSPVGEYAFDVNIA